MLKKNGGRGNIYTALLYTSNMVKNKIKTKKSKQQNAPHGGHEKYSSQEILVGNKTSVSAFKSGIPTKLHFYPLFLQGRSSVSGLVINKLILVYGGKLRSCLWKHSRGAAVRQLNISHQYCGGRFSQVTNQSRHQAIKSKGLLNPPFLFMYCLQWVGGGVEKGTEKYQHY